MTSHRDVIFKQLAASDDDRYLGAAPPAKRPRLSQSTVVETSSRCFKKIINDSKSGQGLPRNHRCNRAGYLAQLLAGEGETLNTDAQLADCASSLQGILICV